MSEPAALTLRLEPRPPAIRHASRVGVRRCGTAHARDFSVHLLCGLDAVGVAQAVINNDEPDQPVERHLPKSHFIRHGAAGLHHLEINDLELRLTPQLSGSASITPGAILAPPASWTQTAQSNTRSVSVKVGLPNWSITYLPIASRPRASGKGMPRLRDTDTATLPVASVDSVMAVVPRMTGKDYREFDFARLSAKDGQSPDHPDSGCSRWAQADVCC